MSSPTWSTDTFSSSTTAPITIFLIPNATGSSLNSSFHTRPSSLISLMIFFPRALRSVSAPHGLTSHRTIDLATGGAFLGFFWLAAAYLRDSLVSSSSEILANGSKPSSVSDSSLETTAGFGFSCLIGLVYSYLAAFYASCFTGFASACFESWLFA